MDYAASIRNIRLEIIDLHDSLSYGKRIKASSEAFVALAQAKRLKQEVDDLVVALGAQAAMNEQH